MLQLKTTLTPRIKIGRWPNPSPIKQRFKKASEIIKWLEDEGWEYVEDDELYEDPTQREAWSLKFIHNHAGKEVPQHIKANKLPEEWLEEVAE
jgi:hypothetical protein